ncbi:MAG: zinc ribbon domain-containing protein [Gammaproteobacteria bacterium]|nr:MAG: zinc ribbon domain-containing protein [Gammaproteobacteria bacterium]
MPIYEFECRACAARFDRLQKLSDPDPDVCPECGAQHQVSRRLTAPAFRLAGSGWYETDFKKDGDKKRNLVGKDEGAKPAEAAPKSENSKPAAAPAEAASKPLHLH